jgi:hypothetical protein
MRPVVLGASERWSVEFQCRLRSAIVKVAKRSHQSTNITLSLMFLWNTLIWPSVLAGVTIDVSLGKQQSIVFPSHRRKYSKPPTAPLRLELSSLMRPRIRFRKSMGMAMWRRKKCWLIIVALMIQIKARTNTASWVLGELLGNFYGKVFSLELGLDICDAHCGGYRLDPLIMDQ